MSHDAFRSFIQLLENSGELLRIKDEVDPKYEVCAYCRNVADDDGPALVFEKMKGYDMPAAANIFGTRKRIAMALGIEEKDMVRVIGERLQKRIPPTLISKAEAPCKEIVLTGDKVDLGVVPFPYWNVGDGGGYIDRKSVV